MNYDEGSLIKMKSMIVADGGIRDSSVKENMSSAAYKKASCKGCHLISLMFHQ